MDLDIPIPGTTFFRFLICFSLFCPLEFLVGVPWFDLPLGSLEIHCEFIGFLLGFLLGYLC
jgi:hypothetical protein